MTELLIMVTSTRQRGVTLNISIFYTKLDNTGLEIGILKEKKNWKAFTH